MKVTSFLPQDQVFWYLNKNEIKPLIKNIETDVVVIGGGMSGLTAAQSFLEKGLKVVLLEKNYCGSGATGKSSGFITPDSELPLRHFIKKYGPVEAKRLWQFSLSGVDIIRNNINSFSLACDYQIQDTLVVTNTKRSFTRDIEAEYNARKKLDYATTLYTDEQLRAVLGCQSYQGGVAYPDTFGIHAYHYCIGMKKVLQDKGLIVHEETPAIAIEDHRVMTPQGNVKAQHIIVCTDRYAEALPTLANKVYHVQTFLLISAPLSDAQIKTIFPDRPFMIWDTDLIYHYFRVTGENRLLIGGGNLLYTYASQEKHNNKHIAQTLTRYVQNRFPEISVQEEYIWPGIIGISKDLFPIAGFDPAMPSVYYITATAGLPWAAALGAYSGERIINNNTSLDHYFSPSREFPLGSVVETVLGKKLTFALSNFMTVGSI